MLIVLSFCFEQCFGPFNSLLAERSSETGPLGHLSNHGSWSPSVQKNKHRWGLSFFKKVSKLNLNLENAKRNSDKIFRFWHNCIWKCSYKLSLLRTEYLWSAVNGLKNSPKILYINQRDFLTLNCFQRDQ